MGKFAATAPPRLPGLQDQLQSLNIDREVHKVISPYLSAMRKVLATTWPQLEPELLLLCFLCKRHRLPAPAVAIARQGAERRPQPPLDRRPERVERPERPELRAPRDTEPPPEGLAGLEGAGAAASRSPPRQVLDLEQRDGRFCCASQAAAPGGDLAGKAPPPPLSSRSLRSAGESAAPPAALQSAGSMESTDASPLVLSARPLSTRDGLSSAGGGGLPSARGVKRLEDSSDGVQHQIAMMRQQHRGKFVQNVPILSLKVLSREEQFWIVSKLRPKVYEPGQHIISEGEIGEHLYLIEQGTCSVWKDDLGVPNFFCKIHKGDFFGELAVLYESPRSATIKADTGATVLSLSRDDLLAALSEESLGRVRVAARAQVFNSIPILKKLDPKQKVLLAENLRGESFQPGAVIFHENQRVERDTRRLLIVECGRCTLSRRNVGAELRAPPAPQPLTRQRSMLSRSVFSLNNSVVYPGSTFGMLEMMYGCQHHATLTAQTAVTTLSVSYDDFQKLFCGKVSGTREKESEILLRMMERSLRIYLIQAMHSSLKHATADDLDSILDAAETQECSPWEVVFRKGQELTHVYMLETGTFIEYDGDAEGLGEDRMGSVDCEEHRQPGETFGTQDVVGGGLVAPCTLVAISTCSLLRMARECFAHLPASRANPLLPRLAR